MKDIRYSLNDIILQEVQNIVSTIHTTIPAIVRSFNPTTQTITAQIATDTPTYYGDNIPAGIYHNIPVLYPSGSDWVFYGPLQAGDSVYLLVPHYGIEEYLSGNKDRVASPEYVRKFDLNEAVAITGMFTRNSPSRKNAYKDRVHIAQGNNVISLENTDGITLEAGATSIQILPNGTILLVGNTTLTGNLNLTGNVTITGVTNMVGAVNVTGIVTASGDVIGAGKSLSTHVHAYTDNGAGMSTAIPT